MFSLVLLIFIAVVATTQLNEKARIPVITSQCKKQCQQPGCMSYVLVNFDLACRVILSKHESENEDYLLRYEQRQQYTKIIRSGSKYILCGKSFSVRYEQRSDTLEHLLLVARCSIRPLFHKLDINNIEVKMYPHLNITKVIAAAYMSTERQMLFATMGQQIISVPSEEYGSPVTVKTNLLSFAVAVDTDNRVFIGVSGPCCSVSRMTIDGHDFFRVRQVSTVICAISIDSARNRVFICTRSGVYYMSNGGESGLRVLAKTKISYAMTFDHENCVIYFADGNKIMKMSLSNGNETVALFTTSPPMSILYHRGKIYASYKNRIVRCTDKNNCEKINIESNEQARLFCLIH